MRSSPSEPVARRLSAIAGFYRYATDEDLIDRSPVAGVRRPKVADDSQTTGLDRDQLRAVLALARQRAAAGAGQSSRDLALLTLLAHNGLRIGEALAADATDLGTERGHRVLHITRKGGRRATVVLAPVTARALDDYLTGRDTGPLFITGGGRRYDEPAETGSVPPGAPPRPGRRPGLRRAAQPPQPAPCVRHPGPRRRRVPARRTGRRRARRPPAPPGATTGPGTTSTGQPPTPLRRTSPGMVRRFRLPTRRRGPARKKDDAEDARICCLIALDWHAARKPLVPHDEIGGEMRGLARDDERAARDQRRLLNRLRADLQVTFPAALTLTGDDLGAPTVLRLLGRWPT